jgi:hypothetical protein
MSGQDLVDLIEPMLATPVLRSILSVYVRCIPLEDEREWIKVLEDGITKELSVTQLDISPSLNYPFLESREACLRDLMHELIPYRPHIQLDIRHRLIQWKIDLSRRVLLPRPSSKTMGYHSSIEFWKMVYPDVVTPPFRPVSTCDLEELYSETGSISTGPCEVRYAWKYNDVKPRVYYAMGADAYEASRNASDIFDSLQRLFRNTDPDEVCRTPKDEKCSVRSRDITSYAFRYCGCHHRSS